MTAAPRVARLPRVFSAAVLLLALTAPRTGKADPTALRHPGERPEVVIEGGSHDLVLAGWLLPNLGIALDVGTRGQAVGLSVGYRRTLLQGPKGWGLSVFASGGLRTLLTEPGLALTATPALVAGSFGKGIGTVGVAVPFAVRVGSPLARIPVLIEANVGGRPGPVSFGLRGAIGPVFVPGEPTAIALQWSAWVALALPPVPCTPQEATRCNTTSAR